MANIGMQQVVSFPADRGREMHYAIANTVSFIISWFNILFH